MPFLISLLNLFFQIYALQILPHYRYIIKTILEFMGY